VTHSSPTSIRVPVGDSRVPLCTQIANKHADPGAGALANAGAAAPAAVRAGLGRDDEDAAVVVTILTAIAARAATAGSGPATPRACWGDPRFRIAPATPGPHAWWASGLAP